MVNVPPDVVQMEVPPWCLIPWTYQVIWMHHKRLELGTLLYVFVQPPSSGEGVSTWVQGYEPRTLLVDQACLKRSPTNLRGLREGKQAVRFT